MAFQNENVKSVQDALDQLVSKESLQGYTCTKSKVEVRWFILVVSGMANFARHVHIMSCVYLLVTLKPNDDCKVVVIKVARFINVHHCLRWTQRDAS